MATAQIQHTPRKKLASSTETQRVLDLPRNRELRIGRRPLIMGVLNITPDSFSDGGSWLRPKSAVDHGLRMLGAGADLLDLGAESTRPGGGVYGDGAATVGVGQELDRLMPVLEELRGAVDSPLSIDTRKAVVARAALAAGGDLINDISALSDPEMGIAVAAAGCPLVLMHSRGELQTMQRDIVFEDLLAEVHAELKAAVERAQNAGVSTGQLILDPGIGFGKTSAQNLLLLRNLDFFQDFDLPLMVGASRKSFIGEITQQQPENRLGGSLAATAWSAHHRAAIVRVHDVAETNQFLETWQAIDQAEWSRP
jgi:dihydropteroate synthase